MSTAKPRILIIVRVGRGSVHRSWTWTTHGLVDIALSAYEDIDCSGDGAQFTHYFPGGKFPGVKDFLTGRPEIIDSYDYFWLFEDDLVLPFASLRQILDILQYCPFDLSAPALSGESFFSWPMTVSNECFLFRCTNVVEVMAPIMSRSFLREAIIAFDDNYSGWGHEWLWSKILEDRDRYAAIFDAAPISHTRPFGRGSLYANSGPFGWTPEEDINQLVKKYNLERHKRFHNCFGVTSEVPHRLVAANEFLQHALGGYSQLQSLESDGFVRCIDNLIRDARPTIPANELAQHEGFRAVRDSLKKANILAWYR